MFVRCSKVVVSCRPGSVNWKLQIYRYGPLGRMDITITIRSGGMIIRGLPRKILWGWWKNLSVVIKYEIFLLNIDLAFLKTGLGVTISSSNPMLCCFLPCLLVGV